MNRHYVKFNRDGKILSTGSCQKHMVEAQAIEEGIFVMEGRCRRDGKAKVIFDGFDENDKPISPRVVDKTLEELEAEEKLKPKPLPFEKQQAYITNEQWEDIIHRLGELEGDSDRD